MYLKVKTDWNENFMLYASVAIIACTCLGGITTYAIFQNGNGIAQMIQLLFVVVSCMGVLASILTVQKPKILFNAILLCLGACTLIGMLNMIF